MTAATICPHLTRLQASALLTLLDDLESITLGIEQMPDEFWQQLNAAHSVLSSELWHGVEQGALQ